MINKQHVHIANLARKKHIAAFERLHSAIGYDLSFYRFKNGKLNVSKLARCAGISRKFAERELWRKGL